MGALLMFLPTHTLEIIGDLSMVHPGVASHPGLMGNEELHWAWMLGGSILPRVRNATAHAKYADLEKWEVVAVEASALELIFRIRQNP
jgi:hypothetical protein